MTLAAITAQVRDMYTRFPYPPPGVLAGTPIPAIMDYTRFIFWPERRDLSGLRVLDAGCGTGDTAVAIAAANPTIEVVGIDLSETSLALARAQADQRVALARALVQRLPQDHPFKAREWTDPNWPGDAGLVDLLLHVRDRSYTVPQIFELLDGAGLQLARFMDPLSYEPATYVGQAGEFDALDPRRRAELAELLCGSMRKHSFYATRSTYTPFHPLPAGELLLGLRPRLSPLFAWDSLE